MLKAEKSPLGRTLSSIMVEHVRKQQLSRIWSLEQECVTEIEASDRVAINGSREPPNKVENGRRFSFDDSATSRIYKGAEQTLVLAVGREQC